MNALNNGQPPDVAADVSPTQNVEFVNSLGMYVWAKPTLPIASPAPTLEAVVSMNTFWCQGNGANGQPLAKCNGDGTLKPNYNLTDPQVGYDISLGRWVVTGLTYYSPTPTPTPTPTSTATGSPTATPSATPTPPAYAYVAVSNTGDATGTWTKWSVQVCDGADQPILGWSSGYVGVDVVCFNSDGSLGADDLIVIPNSSLVPAPALSLPAPIAAPCIGTAVARDRLGTYSDLYLVAPVVPGGGVTEPSNCGVLNVNSNTPPYALEYTATSAGVAGASGTLCGSGACTALAASPQFGQPGTYETTHAQQAGCGNNPSCRIDASDARITAAQIFIT